MIVPNDNQRDAAPKSDDANPDGRSRLDDLLDDLPRGRHAGHIGVASDAYFESPLNLASTESLRFDPAKNRASKLLLGVVGGRVVTGPRLPDGRVNRWVEGGTPIGLGDDRHHIVLAGTRVGKGRCAILPVLLTLPALTSCLTIDPKGDLARLSADCRALLHRVGVLDAFGCSGAAGERYACVYNPIILLARGDRRLLVANARLLADALIVTGDFKDKHWDETAKQILAGLIAHAATHGDYEGRRDLVTVCMLSSRLLEPDPHNPQSYWLKEQMLASDAAGGMVRAAARGFYDRSGGEFSSVLSNLRKNLEWAPTMRSVLVGDSIDLRDLKRDLMSLYVTLPAMRMDALRGWLRMVVQMTLAACEEETVLNGNQCVMILDEFHALGRMQALEAAVAQVAGMGVKLYIALQNLSQLQCYERNYETFLANAGSVQVMGSADETSLKYVSSRLGSALTANPSASAPSYEQAVRQAATGESWSVAPHPLMTPEEVGRFFSRDDHRLRQLVLRPGYRPMVLQRAFYDKHELFRGRRHD